ncbi:hypothetical protein EJB05_01697 [Eragrostis curvula]|uniref:NAC domain-containing protein n=1 Tax=Eragrostis curvula TaxID=38414 RepID=A0A5J9WQ77_9POAL|nr:hypothetical protein EJB05_01697 [Eragrostis curvula]
MALARRAPGQPPLPPGFRFCPTDGELVLHYLRRRAHGVPLPAEVDIPDVRILQHDPSDLLPPGWAEPERYFFTCKEAKYVKGRRANRATGAGYWKATGKEKPVAVTFAGAGGQPPVLVGMKRSLVFYRGRPPTGTKTDWVMHEYRLAGAALQPTRRAAAPAEGWVLCRVFNKKRAAGGPGSSTAAADPAAPEEQEQEEMEMEEAVVDEEEETEDEKEAEEEDKAAAAVAAPAAAASSGFIDFFARAEGAAQQQQGQQQGEGRAASPVVSSSCLTDE